MVAVSGEGATASTGLAADADPEFLFSNLLSQFSHQGVDQIREEDMPFDQAHAAALANVNPDFPGSCGRCYEVRMGRG